MIYDLPWMAKANSYITKGFMKHERLEIYIHLIKDEAIKHMNRWYSARNTWCNYYCSIKANNYFLSFRATLDKVDLFPAVSNMITLINIRCMLGDDAYEQFGEEIASSYYEVERTGTSLLYDYFGANLDRPQYVF